MLSIAPASLFQCCSHHPHLYSFPTRRSSDLREMLSIAPAALLPSGYHCTRRCMTDELRSIRSEEHTSELQSQFHLVCRLLLEKKCTDELRSIRSEVHTSELQSQLHLVCRRLL